MAGKKKASLFFVGVFCFVASLSAQEVLDQSNNARGDFSSTNTTTDKPPESTSEKKDSAIAEPQPKISIPQSEPTFLAPQREPESSFTQSEPKGFIAPTEQEAPLLGLEQIPFWHNTRLSLAPIFTANVPEVRQVVPYGYGAILGYEWMPAGKFYPDFKVEVSFLNYGSSPHRVTGGSWALGLHWVYPLKLNPYPMAIQAALLPGTAIYQVEDRIETRTVHKFQGNVVVGYEIEFYRQFFVFLQSRYIYIYDPKVPFHSTGFAIGVAYHLWAPLRNQKRKPYSDF